MLTIPQFLVGTVLVLTSSLGLCAEPEAVPLPKATRSDEAVRKTWSAEAAATYLDGVAVNWTRTKKCITCHTNMPYVIARPALKAGGSTGWKEVRGFLEADVKKWNEGGKPRGDAYVVATATALAFSDARTTGKLHPLTRDALDRLWTIQKKTGEWNWLKCDWPPQEHDDYYGAVLAALAVGVAPEDYARSEKAQAGIAKLKDYLKQNPAPDLHHELMLLWASTYLEGIMTAEGRNATVRKLKALQREDGGWCLPSLGNYVRRDDAETPNSPKSPSDGYGTGYAVFMLRQAGLPVDDPAVSKGVTWLKSHQRESGRWYTRSLNTDSAHYITNVGTAFAVLALESCGELK